MRQHPTYAQQLLSPIAYLRLALDIPYCHHEKWDGTGYRRGLKGEQIPLAALKLKNDQESARWPAPILATLRRPCRPGYMSHVA